MTDGLMESVEALASYISRLVIDRAGEADYNKIVKRTNGESSFEEVILQMFKRGEGVFKGLVGLSKQAFRDLSRQYGDGVFDMWGCFEKRFLEKLEENGFIEELRKIV